MSDWNPLVPSHTPAGPAGGDLTGTYPNPGVAKVNGVSGIPLIPTSQTGDYTANPGDLVIADKSPAGLQTITLPTSFTVGTSICVVRGANTGNIRLAAGAGATISGATPWTAQAVNSTYLGGTQPGSQTITVVAASSTLWLPVSFNGFVPSTSGFSQVFADLWITGSAFFNFQHIISNVVSVSSAANFSGSSLVVLAGGAGGYNLTCTGGSLGQVVFLKNNSSGNVTIVPQGSGTIDGAATLVLTPTHGAVLLNTTGGSNGNWTQLAAV